MVEMQAVEACKSFRKGSNTTLKRIRIREWNPRRADIVCFHGRARPLRPLGLGVIAEPARHYVNSVMFLLEKKANVSLQETEQKRSALHVRQPSTRGKGWPALQRYVARTVRSIW